MYSVKKLTELFNKNPLVNRQIYTSHGSNGPLWTEWFIQYNKGNAYLYNRTITVERYKYGMDKNNPKLISLKLLYLSNLYDKSN